MKTQIRSILHETPRGYMNLKRVISISLAVQALAILLLTVAPSMLRAQTVSFAGLQITVPFSGVESPWGITTDAVGNAYVVDEHNNQVVKISPLGVQSVLPFTGLKEPEYVAVDSSGNVYVTDTGNARVVFVTPAGAGGTIPITAITLSLPTGIAVDASGNLYVADFNASAVVKVQLTGNHQSKLNLTGIINPYGLAIDSADNLYVADFGVDKIIKYSNINGQESLVPTTGLEEPVDVAVDSSGNVYITDLKTLLITEVTPAGVQTTLPITGLVNPWGVGVDASGNVFVADTGTGSVDELAKSGVPFGNVNVCQGGSPAPCSQTLTLNYNVTASGTLGSTKILTLGVANRDFTGGGTCAGAVTSGSTCAVVVDFTPEYSGVRPGAVQILAGSGSVLATTPIYGYGQAPQIAFYPSLTGSITPTNVGFEDGVAVDAAGALFIGDDTNLRVVKVIGTTVTQVVGGLAGNNSLALDGAGNLYVADPNRQRVLKVTPAGAQSTVGTGLSFPQGVAVDVLGNVYISDTDDNRVVVVPANGSPQFSLATTGLELPVGLTVDGMGNVFVTNPDLQNVLKISPFGSQTTVASGLPGPLAIKLDGAGNLIILNFNDDTVTMVPADGSASRTIATGLNKPLDLAVDGAGDVYVADQFNSRVFVIERNQATDLSFATTPYGETSTDSPMSVVVQNIGNEALNAIAPGLTISPASFAQVPGSGTPPDCTATFSLGDGSSCNLSLSFTPQTVGSINGDALLYNNALNSNPTVQAIGLSGTAVQATPTITFSVANQTYGVAPFTVSATSNSPGPFTYSVVSGPATISSSTVTITGGGSVTLKASQAATIDYTAGSIDATFTVSPATPTLSFSVANQVLGTPPFTVSAVSDSPGAITYSVVSGPATISGSNTVTLTGLGAVTLLASQAATANYLAATIQASFTVLGKSETFIPSLTSTAATIDVFGFGFTPPSGTLAFTDVTSGNPVAAPVTLNTATATTALTPQTTTSTGANSLPVWTELGDVNGDGIPDLITSLYLTDSVSVQLGNGDGTFQTATNIPIFAGFGPAEVHAVSLRGNGVLDLIIGSFNLNEFAVLLGNGDGTFGTPTFYIVDTGLAPTSLTTGDFNGDGKLDVAAAYADTNNVYVFLGDGAGNLSQLGEAINVGRTPQAIRAGNFHGGGDNFSDLVVANYSDGTITTLLNNENGTFTPTTISVGSGAGSGPQALAINGAGSSLLLAVANYRDNTVSVLTGNGDGSFGVQKIVNVGKGPDDVNFADFNGDGIPDLAVSNYTDNTVNLVLGNGSGNYSLVGTFTVGTSPYSAAVGDIDRDGTPDVVVSNCYSNNTGTLLDGTQISVPYSGLSLTPGDTVQGSYTPDGASKYGPSTSSGVVVPSSLFRSSRKIRGLQAQER
jgi:sugar lactone lactonase YvrE